MAFPPGRAVDQVTNVFGHAHLVLLNEDAHLSKSIKPNLDKFASSERVPSLKFEHRAPSREALVQRGFLNIFIPSIRDLQESVD
jgi:hypothetical protein